MNEVKNCPDVLSDSLARLILRGSSKQMNAERIEMNNGEAGPSGLARPEDDAEMAEPWDEKQCIWRHYDGVPPVYVDDGFGKDATLEDKEGMFDPGWHTPFHKYQVCEDPDGNEIYRMNPRTKFKETQAALKEEKRGKANKGTRLDGKGGVEGGSMVDFVSSTRAWIAAIQHPDPPVLFAGTDHEVRPLLMKRPVGTSFPATAYANITDMEEKANALENDPDAGDEFRRLVNNLVAQKEYELQYGAQGGAGLYVPGGQQSTIRERARRDAARMWASHVRGRNVATSAPPTEAGADWEPWLRTNVFQQGAGLVTLPSLLGQDAPAGKPNENRRVQMIPVAGTRLIGKEFGRAKLYNVDPVAFENVSSSDRDKFTKVFNPAYKRFLNGEITSDELPNAREAFKLNEDQTFANWDKNSDGGEEFLPAKIQRLMEDPEYNRIVAEQAEAAWTGYIKGLMQESGIPVDFLSEEELEANLLALPTQTTTNARGQTVRIVPPHKKEHFYRKSRESVALRWGRGAAAAAAGGGGTTARARPQPNRDVVKRSRDEQLKILMANLPKDAPPPTNKEIDDALQSAYGKSIDGYWFQEKGDTLRSTSYKGFAINNVNWQRTQSIPLLRTADFPIVPGSTPGVYPEWLGYTEWKRRYPTPRELVSVDTEEILNEGARGQVEVVWFATLQSQMNTHQHLNFMDPETNINEMTRMSRIFYARQYGAEDNIPPVLNIGMLEYIKEKVAELGGGGEAGFNAFILKHEAYLQEMEVYRQALAVYAKPLADWQTYRNWYKKVELAERQHRQAHNDYIEWYLTLPSVDTASGGRVPALKSNGLGASVANGPDEFPASKRRLLNIQPPSTWNELEGGYLQAPLPADHSEYVADPELLGSAPPLPYYEANLLWDASNPERLDPDLMPSAGVEPDEPLPVVVPMPLTKNGRRRQGWLLSGSHYDDDPSSEWPPIRSAIIYELHKLGLFAFLKMASPSPSSDGRFWDAQKHKAAYVLHYALYPAQAVRNARLIDQTEQRKMLEKFATEYAAAARIIASGKAKAGAVVNQFNRGLEQAANEAQANQPAERAALDAANAKKEADEEWQRRKAARERAAAEAQAPRELSELDAEATQQPSMLWAPYANGQTGTKPRHPIGFAPVAGKSCQRYEREDEWQKRRSDWLRFEGQDHRRLPWEPRRHEASYYIYVSGGNKEALRVHPNAMDPTMADDRPDIEPIGSRPEETSGAFDHRVKEYQTLEKEANAQRAANPNAVAVAKKENRMDRLKRERAEKQAKKAAELQMQLAEKQAADAETAAANERRRDEPPLSRARSRGDGVDARMQATRLEAQQPVGQVDFGALRAFANLSIHQVGVALIGMSGEDRAAVLEQIRGMGPEMEKAARILMAREVVRRVDK